MNRLDSLWKFYDEHGSHARAHEDQRERMTGLLITIAGVLIAFFGAKEASLAVQLTGAALLVVLGVYGHFFSRKHYERNRFHTKIMRSIRSEIDLELEKPGQSSTSLKALRAKGAKDHYDQFPKEDEDDPRRCAKSWLARTRLNRYWAWVPLFVVLVGVCLGIAALRSRKTPTDSTGRSVGSISGALEAARSCPC
jgi:multisubunit Na+/H+ antiporter MnhG subunit